MPISQKNRPIQVATPLGDDVLLFYRMQGKERLDELFGYELELLSKNAAIDPDKMLGENVTVREYCVLYRETDFASRLLEPDIAECAPYLIRLEPDAPFTQWAIGNCLGKHWGIFALSRADLRGLLQHLRKHNMVYSRDKQPQLFRYYDPRVLRGFLRKCDAEQLADFFGPVEAFFAEAADEEGHHRFDRPAGLAEVRA